MFINVPSQQPDGQLQKLRIIQYLILWLNTILCLPTPGEGESFRTHPDRPWGPPSLLHNGYRVSFRGVKRPGHGVDHPSPCSAKAKERVELYVYSPSGLSWHAVGQILPLPLTFLPPVHDIPVLEFIISASLHYLLHDSRHAGSLIFSYRLTQFI